MSLSGMVGRLLKRLILRPRVKRMTWEQLRRGALASALQYAESIEGLSEEAAAVSPSSGMNIRDIVAHLTVANEATAARLDALRAGTAMDSATPELFPGAGGRTFRQALADYRASLARLERAAQQRIDNGLISAHDFFGPMSAPEWLATVAFHHEYHARQTTRIMRSEAFRAAQGVDWSA